MKPEEEIKKINKVIKETKKQSNNKGDLVTNAIKEWEHIKNRSPKNFHAFYFRHYIKDLHKSLNLN